MYVFRVSIVIRRVLYMIIYLITVWFWALLDIYLQFNKHWIAVFVQSRITISLVREIPVYYYIFIHPPTFSQIIYIYIYVVQNIINISLYDYINYLMVRPFEKISLFQVNILGWNCFKIFVACNRQYIWIFCEKVGEWNSK